MQGGDPQEDNIESVDDVTGSDPDLIQQEVITNLVKTSNSDWKENSLWGPKQQWEGSPSDHS